MKTIGQRIKSAREMKGYTQAQIAAELNVNRVSVTQWEGDVTKPSSEKYEMLAQLLGGSAEWYLSGKGAMPVSDVLKRQIEEWKPKPNASFPPVYQRFDGAASTKLLGQVSGGPNGRFILNGTEVGRVFTPPDLIGVEDAYAVRVWGTSMEPRFMAGETVWINPHEPVRSGNDVVVQLLTDVEYERESYIKKFVSQSSKVLRLWQHNPEEGEENELEFDMRRVFSVHKIVFHDTA